MEKKYSEDRLLEEQIKEMQRREVAKTRIIGITVREIAKLIIEENKDEHFSTALSTIIATKILDTKLTTRNFHKIGKDLDKIRLEKKQELAEMLKISKNEKVKQRLKKLIKEIRFLSRLIRMIIIY